MALRVTCPNGHILTLKDDKEGAKIRCPKCKEVFVAQEDDAPPKKKPAAKAPARGDAAPKKVSEKAVVKKRKKIVDDDEDDDDGRSSNLTPEERRKRRVRDKKDRLKKVFHGLLVHIIKLWMVVVVVLFLFLSVIFRTAIANARVGDEPLSRESVEYFTMAANACEVILLIVLVATPIAGVVGCAICSMVPKKSDTRGTIITSLVFDVIPLIAAILVPLVVFDVFALDPAKKERFLTLLLSGIGFFSLSALFLFILFLRQLSYYLQNIILAAEGLNLLTWLMILTVSGPVALVGLTYLAPIVIGFVGGVLNVAVMFLITLIWFAVFYYLFFNGLTRYIGAIRDKIGVYTGLKKPESDEEEEEEDEEEDDD